jgi:cytochrome o ubiquinol oxidase operon protein cyoD
MSESHNTHQSTHGSYAAYIVGFVLSVVLTLVAYFTIVNGWLSGRGALLFVAALAIVQLLVQLLFFLHLGEERGPRWNLMSFLFAGLVVIIVVVGSLWIMHNLNHNMGYEMTPAQEDQSIIKDEGIQPENQTH